MPSSSAALCVLRYLAKDTTQLQNECACASQGVSSEDARSPNHARLAQALPGKRAAAALHDKRRTWKVECEKYSVKHFHPP